MQKSCEALADARKIIRNRIEKIQWTYCSSFMSKTWFYSLAPLFWFFCFLIRNFNSFCSSFYYCNWRKNSHHHTYSTHHANSERLIFSTTTLILGNASIWEGKVFIFSQIFITGLTKSCWINKCKTIIVISLIAAHKGDRDWVRV